MKKSIQVRGLILALLLLPFFISIQTTLTTLSAGSYTTAYEGAKARYYGVYDVQRDLYFSQADKGEASVATFDTVLKFDEDHKDYYLPNLIGETTAIQIPLGESKWIPPDWVPQEWYKDTLYWESPDPNPYEWEVKEGDETYFFRMEEWKTTWYFSISAEYDSVDAFPGAGSSGYESYGRYRNTEVWFEIDLEPAWYFENQTSAYFAIAKIELSHINFFAKQKDGSVETPSNELSVAPESVGSILTIYQDPFGVEGYKEKTAYEYKGKKLNPTYFTDKVYVHFDLVDFGCVQYWDSWPHWIAKGDVITVGFTVTQFVIGEWKVQDVGDIPEDYGRTAKVTRGGWDPNVILGNPLFWLGLGLSGLLLLLILILIFAPGVLVVLTSAVLGRKRR